MISKKVLHLSHDDKDGLVSLILTKSLYPSSEIVYLSNYEVDSRILKLLDDREYEAYDLILITDISPSQDVAQRLNEEISSKVLLFDHHDTSLLYNDLYSWATVVKKQMWRGQEELSCGASLLYVYYLSQEDTDAKLLTSYEDLVDSTRLYDTWDWQRRNLIAPVTLNDLLFLIGKKEFLNRFLTNPSTALTSEEAYLIRIDNMRKQGYLRRKEKEVIEVDCPEGIRVGFVIAEQYISELGHHLLEVYPEYDVIGILKDSYKLSFRSRDGGYDLEGFILARGGGGHSVAAGCSLNKRTISAIRDLVLSLP